MQSPGREPSMEDILASIKKVIAEEKELRTTGAPSPITGDETLSADIGEAEEDVLELDEPLAPPADLGPPLLDEGAAGHSREAAVYPGLCGGPPQHFQREKVESVEGEDTDR